MAGFEPASSPAPKAGGVTGLPNISLFILAVLTGFEPATFPQTTGYPTIGRQDLFLRTYLDSNQDLLLRTGATLTIDDFRLIKLYVLFFTNPFSLISDSRVINPFHQIVRFSFPIDLSTRLSD